MIKADWIVQGLTIWLNDLWLIELSGDWPTDWIIYGWLNCPGTDHLTYWFVADWIDRELTNWLNDLWLIELSGGLTNWLNDSWLIDWLSNWLYCPGADQLTEWFMTNWLNDLWLVDWLSNWLYCPGLTNSLNDLLLIDWLSNWLYCLGADQLTEWFMADWLAE